MSYSFICNLLLFLLVYAGSANSQQVRYYITPSPSVHCPGDPCLTLAQFAADSISYLGNEINVSLSFLPGNHSLDEELSLSHADNLSMTKVIGGNGTVFVQCGGLSGRFNISETTFATIKDVHFVGCGNNRISKVKQLIVEDTIFEGVEGRGTALMLNEVTNATIARSSFLSNVHASAFEYHNISPYASNQEILNYLLEYLNRNPSFAVGGAVYMAFSNVSIVGSKFLHNTAEIGGALFAHNSSLHIDGSTYSYNKASFGGVIFASECLINIKNDNFIENTVMIYGGVMIAYKNSLSISNTTFSANSAGVDGGVIETFESFVNVTGSTFSDNSAGYRVRAGLGGVMDTSDSLLIVTSSTFTNNSAAYGGVVDAADSSIIITSSTFTNNSAGIGGGVISTSDSSLYITCSTFINNSADSEGGVIRGNSNSSFISGCTFTNNHADGGVISTSDS